MGKKAEKSSSKPKKLARSSTMVNTIAEGEKFMKNTKKKVTKTKTMAETLKAAEATLNPKREKSFSKASPAKKAPKTKAIKKAPKVTPKKVTQKPTRKAVPKSTPKKETKKAPKKTTKKFTKGEKPAKSVKDKKASPGKRLTRPSKPAKPAAKPFEKKDQSVPKSGLKKTESKKSVKGDVVEVKKTIFKTKSKENLPVSAFGCIDVCFCIDTTGSMSGELKQAESTIKSIIKNIQKKVQTEGITLRFAVVTYRDHPPQDHTYVTRVLDFTDEAEAISYLEKLAADGGGDFPEAVHDGLMDCCNKLRWMELPAIPSVRYIFHIADAPPHGSQFEIAGSISMFGGSPLVPKAPGCTCGIQTQDVLNAMNRKQIHYRLIKARENPCLNKMEEIFKAGLGNFDSTSIGKAKQMDVRVSDMIIHEILPDYA